MKNISRFSIVITMITITTLSVCQPRHCISQHQEKHKNNPHAIKQFNTTMDMFKKRCKKDCSGPLCKPFSDFSTKTQLHHDDAIELAKKFTEHCPEVKELSCKIKESMLSDEQVKTDIKKCREIGDKECFDTFEKHLRAKARHHCGISCLFSTEKKDRCMAAAFVAAIECLNDPQ